MSQCAIPYTHNLKVINEAIYNGYATGVPNTIDEIVELMKISNEILYVDEVLNRYRIKGSDVNSPASIISERISNLASKKYAKAGGVDKTMQNDTRKQMQLGNALHAIGHASGILYNEMKKLPANRALRYNYRNDIDGDEAYNEAKAKNNNAYNVNLSAISKIIRDYLITPSTIESISDPALKAAVIDAAKHLNMKNTDKGLFALDIDNNIITDMVQTTMYQIDEVYKKQDEVDPTKNPNIFFEQAVMDLTLEETLAGRGDIIVVFSDKTGGYIDYKTYEPNSSDIDRTVIGEGEDKYTQYTVAQANSFGYPRLEKWRQTVPAYEKVLKKRYGVTNMRMSRVVPIATFWGKNSDLTKVAAAQRAGSITEADAKELYAYFYNEGVSRSNKIHGIESGATVIDENLRPEDYTKKIVDVIISKEIIGEPTIAAFVNKKRAQIENFKNKRTKSSDEIEKKIYSDKIAAISDMINNVILFDSLEPTLAYLETLLANIDLYLDSTTEEPDPELKLQDTYQKITRAHQYIEEISYYEDLGKMIHEMYSKSKNISREDAELLEMGASRIALQLMVKKQELRQAEHTYLTNIDSRIGATTENGKVAFEQGGIFKEWTQGASNSNNPFINTVFKLISNLTRKTENDFGNFLEKSDKVFLNLQNWMKANNWNDSDFHEFFVGKDSKTGNIKSMYSGTANEEIMKHMGSGYEAAAEKEAIKFFTSNFKLKENWEERFQKFFIQKADTLIASYKVEDPLMPEDKRDRLLRTIQNKLEDHARSNGFFKAEVQVVYSEEDNEVQYAYKFDETKVNIKGWRNAKNRAINTEWKEVFKEKHYTDSYRFMQKNPPLLEWYENWKDNIMEARRIYGIYDNSKLPVGFIPNIRKEAIDMMRSSGIFTGIGKSFQVGWQHLQIDNDELISMQDENGNEIKSIPMPYLKPFRTKKIVDGKEVYVTDVDSKSFDMQRVLVEFMRSAYAYKHKQNEEPILQALRDTMEDAGEMYVKDRKDNLIDQDGSPMTQSVKDFGKDELANFDKYLDVYLYGQTVLSKDQSIGGVSMNKALMAAQHIYSKKILGYSLYAPISAAIAGTINTKLTAVKGAIFTEKDYTKGVLRKGLHIGNTFGSATAEGKKVKMLLKHFDPYMRSEYASAGLERTNKSAIEKFFSDRTAFYAFQKADDLLMDAISLSMTEAYVIDVDGNLRHRSNFTKAQLESGVYKTLWESFSIVEKGDEVIAKVVGHDGKELTPDQVDNIVVAFKNATRQAQRGIMGSQSEQDISLYSTHILGKLAGMFRNWIPNLLNEMVKPLEYNKNTDIIDIGRYTALTHAIAPGKDNEWKDIAIGIAKVSGFIALDLIPYLNLTAKYGAGNDTKARQWFENWKRNHPQLSKDQYGKDITFEQYTEAKRRQLRTLVYQIRILAVLTLLTALAGGDWEGDDEPDYRKYWATRQAYRLLNRVWRETASMHSLSDFDAIVGGSIIPLWNMVTDIGKLFANMADETRDLVVGENSKSDNTPIGYYTIGWAPLLARIRQIFELSDQAYKSTR